MSHRLHRSVLSTIAFATLAALWVEADDEAITPAPVFDARLDALASMPTEPISARTQRREVPTPTAAAAPTQSAPAARPPTRTIVPLTVAAPTDAASLDASLHQLATLAGQQPGQAPAIAERLLALEPLAAEHDQLAIWLEALTATAAPAALPAARRHLAHELPPVRAAAITAVLRIAGAQSRDELSRVLFTDPSPLVRTRAITALAGAHDRDSLTALQRILDHETEADVRIAAVLALAQHDDRDTTAPILRRLAAADPATSLRAVASQLLASR